MLQITGAADPVGLVVYQIVALSAVSGCPLWSLSLLLHDVTDAPIVVLLNSMLKSNTKAAHLK